MFTLKLKELLDEFEEWVVEGRAKKIPYQEWRWLKQHAEDQVRIVRDGWGDLGIFSETRCKFLVEGWPYDDNSLGTYLDNIYIHEFDNCLANKYSQGYYYDSSGLEYVKRDDTGFSATNKIDGLAEKTTSAVEITENGINIQSKNISDTIIEKINEAAGFSINGKEKDNMDLIKNFDFGSCANDNVKVSMYGIAVKNANGTWVSYDTKSGNVMDVDILNFDGKYLYKMPVALKDVKSGDVVIHNRKPMFVSKVEGGKILAIDPAAGEEKVIMLTKNMFGFDFATKVINLFEGFTGGASADAPFGNMFPLMMLADNKNNDMLPFMLMMNGSKMDSFNPMMMYFLMKDNKGDNDMLPFLLMSNFSGNCNCHCDCDCDCDREG